MQSWPWHQFSSETEMQLTNSDLACMQQMILTTDVSVISIETAGDCEGIVSGAVVYHTPFSLLLPTISAAD